MKLKLSLEFHGYRNNGGTRKPQKTCDFQVLYNEINNLNCELDRFVEHRNYAGIEHIHMHCEQIQKLIQALLSKSS